MYMILSIKREQDNVTGLGSAGFPGLNGALGREKGRILDFHGRVCRRTCLVVERYIHVVIYLSSVYFRAKICALRALHRATY